MALMRDYEGFPEMAFYLVIPTSRMTELFSSSALHSMGPCAYICITPLYKIHNTALIEVYGPILHPFMYPIAYRGIHRSYFCFDNATCIMSVPLLCMTVDNGTIYR